MTRIGAESSHPDLLASAFAGPGGAVKVPKKASQERSEIF
jgi:hypothetical protein